MFEHILVPLDGSTLAEGVLPHATAVARAFGAQISLVCVLAPPSSERHPQPIDPVDWEMRKIEAKSYLKDLAQQMQQVDISVTATVLEGNPAQNIIEFARDKDVNLVVISSHGSSGASSWTLGSVAQKVIQHVHKSVLLVRAYQVGHRNAVIQDAAEVVDLATVRYSRILVPLDGSQRADCATAPAAKLATFYDSSIVLASVVREPDVPNRAPPSSEDIALASQLKEHHRQRIATYLEQMQSQLPSAVETRIMDSDDVVVCLERIVDEEAIDLVVASAHGRSGRTKWPYGNVTSNLILYGSSPLLIVQDLQADEIEPTQAELAFKERQGHR